MRRNRQVVNRVASLPRESAQARDTLGGSRHCGVVSYGFAVRQNSILRSCGDFELDRLLVPDPVSQRKTTRTSETISIGRKSLTLKRRDGGRYRIRTYDFHRVKMALYR